MGPPSKKIKPVTKASNESPKSSTKKEESTSPTAEGEIKVVQHNQESVIDPKGTRFKELIRNFNNISFIVSYL